MCPEYESNTQSFYFLVFNFRKNYLKYRFYQTSIDTHTPTEQKALTAASKLYFASSCPEESCPFKVKGHVPPQIFEPSGFLYVASKRKKKQIGIFYI